MSDVTPLPEDFEADHFPVRGNDWLVNDAEEIAQVRAVYAAKDYGDENQRLRFYVDLVFYDHSGRKIGRKSVNPPSTMIGGVMRRGEGGRADGAGGEGVQDVRRAGDRVAGDRV